MGGQMILQITIIDYQQHSNSYFDSMTTEKFKFD